MPHIGDRLTPKPEAGYIMHGVDVYQWRS